MIFIESCSGTSKKPLNLEIYTIFSHSICRYKQSNKQKYSIYDRIHKVNNENCNYRYIV